MLIHIDTDFRCGRDNDEAIEVTGTVVFVVQEGEHALGKRSFDVTFSTELLADPEETTQSLEITSGGEIILDCQGQFFSEGVVESLDDRSQFSTNLFLALLMDFLDTKENQYRKLSPEQHPLLARQFLTDLWRGRLNA